jgi:hypothetical protein
MTTANFGFYLQNRLIQTSQTGGQRYNYTSPFSIPWPNHSYEARLSKQDGEGAFEDWEIFLSNLKEMKRAHSNTRSTTLLITDIETCGSLFSLKKLIFLYKKRLVSKINPNLLLKIILCNT